MSLLFGGATSHRSDHGSPAIADDLAAFTYLLAVYPTSLVDARTFLSKSTSGTSGQRFRLVTTSGDLAIVCTRATTNLSYTSNSAPLAAVNAWYWVAATVDINGSAGDLARIYAAPFGASLAQVTYALQTDGSGAQSANAAGTIIVGNDAGNARSFPGRIALAMAWSRRLSLGELITQQSRPFASSGCFLYTHLGWNGTGSQVDYSGQKNHGTVTGATAAAHAPIRPPFGQDVPWVPIVNPAPVLSFGFAGR
jgi:hypothetical protein